jgi:hypothetical protein
MQTKEPENTGSSLQLLPLENVHFHWDTRIFYVELLECLSIVNPNIPGECECLTGSGENANFIRVGRSFYDAFGVWFQILHRRCVSKTTICIFPGVSL